MKTLLEIHYIIKISSDDLTNKISLKLHHHPRTYSHLITIIIVTIYTVYILFVYIYIFLCLTHCVFNCNCIKVFVVVMSGRQKLKQSLIAFYYVTNM